MARQASSSAVLRSAAVVWSVMLLTLDSFAAAATVVGGSAGWTMGHNYGHLSVKHGDALVFNYNRKFHNVLQVSEADYNKCHVPSRPIKAFSSGRDSVKLNNAGTFYFLCGIPGHCASGMKVAITAH